MKYKFYRVTLLPSETSWLATLFFYNSIQWFEILISIREQADRSGTMPVGHQRQYEQKVHLAGVHNGSTARL